MPVKLSSLIPKSISLFAQLVLTFVALVAATATGLTVFSYRASLDNLQAAAQRNADMVAETRVQMLAQLLAFRRERADGFLATAESVCGEPAGSRVGWSEPCVRTMLREFRLTEGAEGATLTYRGRRLSAAGESVSTVSFSSMPADSTPRDMRGACALSPSNILRWSFATMV